MASTIKVNNIQNQCGANIANKCGTTITLGASGDTIQLACGASQTGFGRTGTVDWDTTAKTTNFTAVSGNGYFVNTTSGAITVTLPASPSAGDIVAIKDYAGTFATNNCTVARNGSNIGGIASDLDLNVVQQSVTFVYVDGTKGWLATNDSTTNAIPQKFVTATGGTITTCGDYKIHKFTGPGTFCVSCAGNPAGSTTVDYLVVGGGAGTPESNPGPDYNYAKGGGGAGGFRESSGAASGCYSRSPLGACVSALPVSATGYPITVGGGGSAGAPGGSIGSNGSNSIFSTITSTGGGYGGSGGTGSVGSDGASGGSGGGGGAGPGVRSGGTGNTPPVSPPQGNSGGTGTSAGATAGGGGGGATAAGTNGGGCSGFGQGGNGGNGATTSISGTPTAYAGGGGGGSTYVATPGAEFPSSTVGTGGAGGGGNGTKTGTANSGTANTGGGAGGTGAYCSPNNGGSGGSGIVIIRYKYQ